MKLKLNKVYCKEIARDHVIVALSTIKGFIVINESDDDEDVKFCAFYDVSDFQEINLANHYSRHRQFYIQGMNFTIDSTCPNGVQIKLNLSSNICLLWGRDLNDDPVLQQYLVFYDWTKTHMITRYIEEFEPIAIPEGDWQ